MISCPFSSLTGTWVRERFDTVPSPDDVVFRHCWPCIWGEKPGRRPDEAAHSDTNAGVQNPVKRPASTTACSSPKRASVQFGRGHPVRGVNEGIVAARSLGCPRLRVCRVPAPARIDRSTASPGHLQSPARPSAGRSGLECAGPRRKHAFAAERCGRPPRPCWSRRRASAAIRDPRCLARVAEPGAAIAYQWCPFARAAGDARISITASGQTTRARAQVPICRRCALDLDSIGRTPRCRTPHLRQITGFRLAFRNSRKIPCARA